MPPAERDRRFKKNDKVFAKVRGYPPWPARVEGLADETPYKLKYHIFFYGTRETGICRQEELYNYSAYKEKYGKGVKRKFFNEALAEIESDVEGTMGDRESKTPAPVDGGKSESEAHTGSENEDSLIIDEASEKKADKSVSRPKSLTPRGSIVNEPTPVTPRVETSSRASPVVKVTTSGRKIKPKKTYDPDDDDTTFSSQTSGTKEVAPLPIPDPVPIQGSIVRAKTPNDKLIVLDINNFTPPESYKTEKALTSWKINKLKEFKEVRQKIETGEPLAPEYAKLVEIQSEKEVQDKLQEDERVLKTQLKIEVDMLLLDLRIKKALSLENVNCNDALKALDEVLALPVTPLILKKHPEIVETVAKVQRYRGNTDDWNMSEEKREDFAKKAAQVRAKAEHIFNKFKNLFTVPAGESFSDFFCKQIITFNEQTKATPVHDLFALQFDPTQAITA